MIAYWFTDNYNYSFRLATTSFCFLQTFNFQKFSSWPNDGNFFLRNTTLILCNLDLYYHNKIYFLRFLFFLNKFWTKISHLFQKNFFNVKNRFFIQEISKKNCFLYCNIRTNWINIRSGGIRLFFIINILGHLPNLHNIILGNGANYPRLILIPTEVGNFSGMSAMNE